MTIEIKDYQPKYQKAFKDLNEEWISQYFKIEENDSKYLNNPQKHIIDRGGFILVVTENEVPIGVCALIKLEELPYDFEMSKMAVAPAAQGKKIGLLLGNAIIEKAKSVGAATIYLESNTILVPAINLYYKLSFQITDNDSKSYERCNIKMLLNL